MREREDGEARANDRILGGIHERRERPLKHSRFRGVISSCDLVYFTITISLRYAHPSPLGAGIPSSSSLAAAAAAAA